MSENLRVFLLTLYIHVYYNAVADDTGRLAVVRCLWYVQNPAKFS